MSGLRCSRRHRLILLSHFILDLHHSSDNLTETLYPYFPLQIQLCPTQNLHSSCKLRLETGFIFPTKLSFFYAVQILSWHPWIKIKTVRIRLEGSSGFQSSLTLSMNTDYQLHSISHSFVKQSSKPPRTDISQGVHAPLPRVSAFQWKIFPMCPIQTSQVKICNHCLLVHCPTPPRTVCFQDVGSTQLLSNYISGRLPLAASSPSSTRSWTLAFLAAFRPLPVFIHHFCPGGLKLYKVLSSQRSHQSI